jgi:hypothetical protein
MNTRIPVFWLSYKRASAMTWQSFGSGPPPEGVKQLVVQAAPHWLLVPFWRRSKEGARVLAAKVLAHE